MDTWELWKRKRNKNSNWKRKWKDINRNMKRMTKVMRKREAGKFFMSRNDIKGTKLEMQERERNIMRRQISIKSKTEVRV